MVLAGLRLIDLHCHILPGLDDGAADLAMSIEMARIAAADGITMLACTPHISPGVYENSGTKIQAAVEVFARILDRHGISLELAAGADVHIAPDLIAKLQSGEAARLGNSRYFLFEPPHDVLPPKIDSFLFSILAAGFTPILTHPERLSWIEQHFPLVRRLAGSGVLIQLTAGSITGQFGKRARYWSDRMIDEGMVDIVASDAHDTTSRPPVLSKARDRVARHWGEETAVRFVLINPLHILGDKVLPESATPEAEDTPSRRGSWLDRLGLTRRGDFSEQ